MQDGSMEHSKTIKGSRRHIESEFATLKPAELARILGIARNGVYAALRSGKIPHIRIGRRFVIPRSALNAWFASALQPAVRVSSAARKPDARPGARASGSGRVGDRKSRTVTRRPL